MPAIVGQRSGPRIAKTDRMRQFTSVLIALSLLFSLSPRTAGAEQREASEPPKLLTQTNCFGALDESYDAWMEFLRQKTSPLEYLKLRYKFSRDQYERYQRTLDCHSIVYLSDGHYVRGWLVQPKRRRLGAPLPVIIFNRGGSRADGLLTFSQVFLQIFPLAERGYMVAASQYRGAIPVPGEVQSPDQFGGEDVRDVTNLMRVVATRPQVDTDNFFMIGVGRGSIMAFRALQDAPFSVRAIAIYSGLFDLHASLRAHPENASLFRQLIPAYRLHPDSELDKRSVNRWVAGLPERTGVLVVQGEDGERNVDTSAREFLRQLEALGRPHQALYFADDSYLLDERKEEVQSRTLAWFRKFKHPQSTGRSNSSMRGR